MRHTGIVGDVLCPVLVGRRAEIQALESALAGALAGEGGCAVITGEAGIGKSRLIRELSQMAAARRVPVVAGRAVPASASSRSTACGSPRPPARTSSTWAWSAGTGR